MRNREGQIHFNTLLFNEYDSFGNAVKNELSLEKTSVKVEKVFTSTLLTLREVAIWLY